MAGDVSDKLRLRLGRRARTACLALLLIQIAGAGCIISTALPIFETLANNPAVRLLRPTEDYIVIGSSIAAMQAIYWYGYLRLEVPFAKQSIILNHAVSFAARISFIFGAALFSIVFFRH